MIDTATILGVLAASVAIGGALVTVGIYMGKLSQRVDNVETTQDRDRAELVSKINSIWQYIRNAKNGNGGRTT